MGPITSASPAIAEKIEFSQPAIKNQPVLIAVAVLMALGMVFSYLFGAPWFIIMGFFSSGLISLFPLRKAIDDQRSRIIE